MPSLTVTFNHNGVQTLLIVTVLLLMFSCSYCSPGMGSHDIWEGLKQQNNKVMVFKNDHQVINLPFRDINMGLRNEKKNTCFSDSFA